MNQEDLLGRKQIINEGTVTYEETIVKEFQLKSKEAYIFLKIILKITHG